jgi:hypothetical protein
MKIITQKKGVTLLFAIIISSAALTVGLSVYSLLSSQIRLSALERDSLQALYAADAGTECIMFWSSDFLYDAFSSTTPKSIKCNNTVFPVGPQCETPTGTVYSPCDTAPPGRGWYKLGDTPTGHEFFPGTGTCTTFNVQPSSADTSFRLQSFGQTASCGLISPNAIQRGYEVVL